MLEYKNKNRKESLIMVANETNQTKNVTGKSPSVQVLPRQLPHPPPGTPDAVVHRLPVCLHVWVGGPAEYGKTLGLFSLSARFAYSNSKLTFVIFRSWQS